MEAEAPSIELLGELARAQGVTPTDEDLEAVLGFLRALLPAFRELEQAIPPDSEP